MSHISSNLFLGDYKQSTDLKWLQEKNIGTIIYIGTHPKPCDLLDQYETACIRHLFIYAEDAADTDLISHFDTLHNILSSSPHPVLVHCMMGISRSATVVVAHLMAKHKWTRYEAFREVQKRRRIVDPNPGFWYQLREWEEELGIESKLLKNNDVDK